MATHFMRVRISPPLRLSVPRLRPHRPHLNHLAVDCERWIRATAHCPRQLVFVDKARAWRRLKKLFPKFRPASCPQEAAWNLVWAIMGHPHIDHEVKMEYWNSLTAEAWPANWRK
jgi:hypothetical protein